jgi:hypothetical protein
VTPPSHYAEAVDDVIAYRYKRLLNDDIDNPAKLREHLVSWTEKHQGAMHASMRSDHVGFAFFLHAIFLLLSDVVI